MHAPISAAGRPSADVKAQNPATKAEPSVGRRYSTGIGGTGNISFARRVDDKVGDGVEEEEMARLLYDRAAPGIMLVEGGYHTGIGKSACYYNDNLLSHSVFLSKFSYFMLHFPA